MGHLHGMFVCKLYTVYVYGAPMRNTDMEYLWGVSTDHLCAICWWSTRIEVLHGMIYGNVY